MLTIFMFTLHNHSLWSNVLSAFFPADLLNNSLAIILFDLSPGSPLTDPYSAHWLIDSTHLIHDKFAFALHSLTLSDLSMICCGALRS